ncbi:Zn-dependent oxidoreductase, NADPH:quinone reductase [Synechococcus sp. PCC 7502]|uniref:NADP-dependent oxidoreductase n=1 Tax=Synechococcus sp. PCC 7502 TaxID=1173263 RepID=UPI00029FB423|nr:NADP-dependent oxidoreductase [Synechococcus sp. PCC 7502]AFY75070.1 Zn-dependent oxidoreductase, NADPH:quinone reductase [Synechococcus sp. PCC 7502]
MKQALYAEAPKPEPKENEVLIRVHGVGVNPADWKIRQGYLASKFPFPMPLILGYDLAGVIESLGDRVHNFNLGDAVMAMLPLHQLGAYAEYVVADAALVAPKPSNLDFFTAAAVPSIALTAWQALFDLAGLESGQKILIHGASGSVGRFAVQFAKWKGAIVFGTASTQNLTAIQQLGVDLAIDYISDHFEDKVIDVDVVLDTIGGGTRARSWQVLKSGGILISTEGAGEPVVSPSPNIRGIPVFVELKDNAQLRQIGDLIENGQIQAPSVETFALSDAALAHTAIQQQHRRGKLVLRAFDG